MCVHVAGQQFDSSYGRPLIILYGDEFIAHSPSFVLYENGQILYIKRKGDDFTVFKCSIDRTEIRTFVRSLGVSDSIYKLPASITDTEQTDQPMMHFVFDLDSVKKITDFGIFRNPRFCNQVPHLLVAVYNNIRSYESKGALEWMADSVEVTFSPYDNAATVRKWPHEFPTPNIPAAKNGTNSACQVFINKSKFPEFKKYFLSMKGKQAVEINGRKMSLEWYHIPFPNTQLLHY